MGLDMYLSKKTYIGNNYKEKAEQTKIDVPNVKQKRVTYIEEEVGYWRKANAIHRFFVENVQHGKDDCEEYCVSMDDLLALENLCKEVLKDKSKAKELLPPQEGFFFGGTEYDESYFKDLEDTIAIIEEVKKEQGSFDLYYQSSW